MATLHSGLIVQLKLIEALALISDVQKKLAKVKNFQSHVQCSSQSLNDLENMLTPLQKFKHNEADIGEIMRILVSFLSSYRNVITTMVKKPWYIRYVRPRKYQELAEEKISCVRSCFSLLTYKIAEMNCNCRNVFSAERNTLIRYCPNCNSSGGQLGSVFHSHDCVHFYCVHNVDKHRNFENTERRERASTTRYEELWNTQEMEQQTKIIKLNSSLLEGIKKKLLEFDKKLYKRVEDIIRIKTKKEIYIPYLVPS